MPTKIEWNEETWNPITGCTPISEGCRNCYAKSIAHRLAGRFGYPAAPDQFKVTLHPDKLDQPDHWKKPRKVFVCSMGDLFHEDVPEEFIIDILITIAANGPCYLSQTEYDPIGKFWPGHTFQILTKRPERMMEIIENFSWELDNFASGNFREILEWYMTDYGHLLPHLHLGVTAENQQAADERIPWLLKTPAAVRFVSVEPMLGPMDIRKFLSPGADGLPEEMNCYHDWLDWVICGGETGPGAREMKTKWAMDLYEQCSDAGVPFFFKKPGDAFTGDIHDLPMENGEFVRQYLKEVIHAAS
jgi:protein gp37